MVHGRTGKRADGSSNGLSRERATLTAMIHVYCQGCHGGGKELCTECGELHAYAMRRLDRCPFGSDKPKCADCSIHCYQKTKQAEIRRVMRYAAPKLAKSTDSTRQAPRTSIS